MAEKRFLKVFLSYAHDDRDTVKELYNRLKADGVDAWLDKVELLPGQDWKREIHKAVRGADVVIVCLSCHYDDKGFRHQEVRIALEEAASQHEGEIFIIPARLEECEPLESLEQWQWVDLFEADGYERLMRALKVRADRIGAELKKNKGSSRVYLEKMMAKGDTRPGSLSSPDQNREVGSQIDGEIEKQTPIPKATTPEPSVEPKIKERKPIKTEYIVAFIGAIATLVGSILGSPVLANHPITSATATFTEPATFIPIVLPSDTATPTIRSTETATSTALPTETATSTSRPTSTKTFTPTATFTPIPTHTPLPSITAQTSPDFSCVTVNEQPIENSDIHRGRKFKVMFTVINNGEDVWPGNLILDISSNPFDMIDDSSFPMRVPRMKPGDFIVIGPFDAEAPEKDGHYVISFKIGDGFCWPYVAFDVVK